MKLVWVNRFNANGTLKPMSEWQQRTVHDATTHVMLEGERMFQGTHDNTLTSNGRSGIHEYIGNQRGDGWFYVADGDLPPIENNAVLCHDDAGVRLMMPEALHLPNTWEYQNKVKCWQPIEPPKHLD